MGITEYWQTIINNKWLIFIPLLIIVGGVLVFNSVTPLVYEANSKIIIEHSPVSIGFKVYPKLGESPTLINNLLIELKSHSFNKKLVERLPQKVKKKLSPNPQGEVRKSVVAEIIRGTDIIDIKVRHTDPYCAMVIANTVVSLIKEISLKTRQEEVVVVRKFIENQLSRYKKQLEEAELALKEFKEKNQIVELKKETHEFLKKLNETQLEYTRTITQKRLIEKRLTNIEKELEKQEKFLKKEKKIAFPLLKKLKDKLMELELEYISLRGQEYSKNDPRVLRLEEEIERTLNKIGKEVSFLIEKGVSLDFLSTIQTLLNERIKLNMDLLNYKDKEKILKERLTTYNKILQTLPEKEFKLTQLLRKRNVADKIYSMLLERYEEACIQEAGKLSFVRILEQASLPVSPISPKKRLNLVIGVVCGILMGIGLIVIKETLEKTFKTIEEVETTLGVKVIGVIPVIEKKKKEQLLYHFPSNSSVVHSFRNLSSWLKTTLPPNSKTILITSALKNEGKSLITANIGIGVSELGEKVILLDCDLRFPSLHKWFNINRKPGLVEVIEGEVKLEEGIQKVSENLFVLTSGKIIELPSLILKKEKINLLLTRLKGEFGLIFIDTPCLLTAVDGVILNTLADHSLFILQYRSTPQDVSLRGKTLLEEGKKNLLGIVFTKVEGGRLKKYYYPYYHPKFLTSSI